MEIFYEQEEKIVQSMSRSSGGPSQNLGPSFSPPKSAGFDVNPIAMGGIGYLRIQAKICSSRDRRPAQYRRTFHAAPRRIIGTDDRVQINQTNVYLGRRSFPSSSKRPPAKRNRNGFFIGPKTIATPGHCVFIRPRDINYARLGDELLRMPGETIREARYLPFGSVVAPKSSLRSVRAWTERVTTTTVRSFWLPSSAGGRLVRLWSVYRCSTGDDRHPADPGDKGGGTQWFHGSNVTSGGPARVFIPPYDGRSQRALFYCRRLGALRFSINAYGEKGGARQFWHPITLCAANLTSWKS
jgi:hypothetical protein